MVVISCFRGSMTAVFHMGRWESIQMVERYTRSVKFDDSLKLYSSIMD